MSEVLVLGGDGFVGWPTALHLAERGDHAIILDSLIRRDIGAEPLTPIASLPVRLDAWTEVAGKENAIDSEHIDIAEEYERLVDVIKERRPDTIVHFAEQRSHHIP